MFDYKKISSNDSDVSSTWPFRKILLFSLLLIPIFLIIILLSTMSGKNHSTSTTKPKATTLKVLLSGGYHGRVDSTMEVYYPDKPQLNHLLPTRMLQGRYDHSSEVTNNGSVLLVGGQTRHQMLSSCELYLPKQSIVTSCPSLPNQRTYAASGTLKGIIYLCGGLTGYTRTAVRSCLRLIDGLWMPGTSMNSKRWDFAMVASDGYLYTTGGCSAAGTLKSVERYDSESRSWSRIASMHESRRGHSAAQVEGIIFACGGQSTSCERFDPNANEWSYIARMKKRRLHFNLVAVGDRLFAFGGSQNRTVEMFDPKGGNWSMGRQLLHERDASSAVVIVDRKRWK